MKIEDLKHVFKGSQCAPADAQTYILSLLNKFEVALTWDGRTLLIPSMLPSEELLRCGLPGADVRVQVSGTALSRQLSLSIFSVLLCAHALLERMSWYLHTQVIRDLTLLKSFMETVFLMDFALLMLLIYCL